MTARPSISLATAHAELGWPAPEEIRCSVGSGANIFAALARAKIGGALSRFEDARDAVVGVLMTDSRASTTESPLGVVVEFQREASEAALRELHRFVWNFSQSPTVITIEPGGAACLDLLRAPRSP